MKVVFKEGLKGWHKDSRRKQHGRRSEVNKHSEN